MSEALLDLFRHHTWANRRIIEVCGRLSADQLTATLIGTFGDPSATLKHILGAEAFYRSMFGLPMDEWRDWTGRADDLSIPELVPWADRLGASWEKLLRDGVDASEILRQTRPDGTVRTFRAGMLLTQTIHHGTVHREQVCSILTSIGVEAPDISAYAYERERV